jgi:hypothetical protein
MQGSPTLRAHCRASLGCPRKRGKIKPGGLFAGRRVAPWIIVKGGEPSSSPRATFVGSENRGALPCMAPDHRGRRRCRMRGSNRRVRFRRGRQRCWPRRRSQRIRRFWWWLPGERRVHGVRRWIRRCGWLGRRVRRIFRRAHERGRRVRLPRHLVPGVRPRSTSSNAPRAVLPDLPAVPTDRVSHLIMRPGSAAHDAPRSMLPRLHRHARMLWRAVREPDVSSGIHARDAARPVLPGVHRHDPMRWRAMWEPDVPARLDHGHAARAVLPLLCAGHDRRIDRPLRPKRVRAVSSEGEDRP